MKDDRADNAQGESEQARFHTTCAAHSAAPRTPIGRNPEELTDAVRGQCIVDIPVPPVHRVASDLTIITKDLYKPAAKGRDRRTYCHGNKKVDRCIQESAKPRRLLQESA